MPHDAFISYSTKDTALAEQTCQALESTGIRCWIAPRNIPPGKPWSREITDAIQASRVLVLIFTRHSDASDNVLNEVSLAQSFEIPVIAFRAEELQPHGLMYHLNAIQWLVAEPVSPERSLPQLVEAVRGYLQPAVAPAPLPTRLPAGGSGIPSSNAPRFIDRGAIMDELRQALRAPGITGLSGMGGLGKTEIAIQLANELEAEQPNSTLWISVAEKPPEDVQAEMAFKLGLRFPNGASDALRWDLLRAHLQTQPRVVFFDDVRKGFLDSLRRCLPPVPPCGVMITSRRGDLPGIPPGAMRALDVMNAEQALVLLRSVRSLESALDKEPDAAQKLIEACRRHPLALSLAASRLLKHLRDSATPVAAFTTLLSHRLAELRLDESSDPLRSLGANFHLSYAELEPPDQLRYRRLAAFAPSGFGLEGAAAVWGDSALPEARRALERFQDASLVLPAEAPGRWRLHDLLQEYAQEQLQACGEQDLSRDLLEQYLVQLFRQHQADLESAPQLPLELDNLQAALQRLEALHQPGANPLVAQRAKALEGISQQYAEVIASRGASYLEMGRYEESLADLDKALQLDPKMAWGFLVRGVAYRAAKRHEESLASIQHALQLVPDYPQALANRGETYRRLNRSEEALADLNQAIEQGFQEAWIFASRAQVYDRLDRLEESLAEFNRAIDEMAFNDAWGYASRGQVYSQMGRNEEALTDFNRALQLDPKADWILASRGYVYFRLHQYQQALADFDAALQLNAQEGLPFAYRGSTHRRMEHYEQAIADLTRAVELGVRNPWVIADRAEARYRLGQGAASLADFDEAEKLGLKEVIVYVRRGDIYRSLGRLEEALVQLDEALRMAPDDPSVRATRGVTYGEMGRYPEALVDLNEAIRLDPQYAWAWYSRGVTYARMALHDQALLDLNHAIVDLGYRDVAAFTARGSVYLDVERYAEALRDLDAALDLHPDHLPAIGLRAETYVMMVRNEERADIKPVYFKKALEDFNRLIQLDPPSLAWVLTRRARAYRLMGQHEAALADFNRSIELDSQNSKAFSKRGELYLELKAYRTALSDFQQALHLEPEKDWTLYLQGLAQAALGEQREAQESFRQAMALAQAAYDQQPKAWQNTFNLALYRLAAGEEAKTETLVRAALKEREDIPAGALRDALNDLETYLAVFPQARFARRMHDLLTGRVE